MEPFEEELWKNCGLEIRMNTLKIVSRTLQMSRSKDFDSLILEGKKSGRNQNTDFSFLTFLIRFFFSGHCF